MEKAAQYEQLGELFHAAEVYDWVRWIAKEGSIKASPDQRLEMQKRFGLMAAEKFEEAQIFGTASSRFEELALFNLPHNRIDASKYFERAGECYRKALATKGLNVLQKRNLMDDGNNALTFAIALRELKPLANCKASEEFARRAFDLSRISELLAHYYDGELLSLKYLIESGDTFRKAAICQTDKLIEKKDLFVRAYGAFAEASKKAMELGEVKMYIGLSAKTRLMAALAQELRDVLSGNKSPFGPDKTPFWEESQDNLLD